MITALVVFIFALAVFQKNSLRRSVCILYAFQAVLCDMFVRPELGAYYFLYAAIADAMCIFLLGFINHVSWFKLMVKRICFISILLNFAGWILYEMYIEPVYYNTAYIILYFAAMLLFLYRGPGYGLYRKGLHGCGVFVSRGVGSYGFREA